jgi:hypothetical protein
MKILKQEIKHIKILIEWEIFVFTDLQKMKANEHCTHLQFPIADHQAYICKRV